jgi:circadian clock protein KaiC
MATRTATPKSSNFNQAAFSKASTGVPGLDEITSGGLPRGRTTLLCGGPGSGKTVLGMQILLQGILQYNENAVCLAFEENEEELTANVKSLGYDVRSLVTQKRLSVDYISVDRNEIEEAGAYDLEGLFVRLDYAIRSVNAKRVLLDSLEYLFSGLSNEGLVRSEIRRLFRWLKDRGITAIVTAEAAPLDNQFTRWGLEEYAADCVIFLDHRVNEQISTRRIRVVKYRGSSHGTNEYPFLLDDSGFSVLPITSLGLTHDAPIERVSTGIDDLDSMLEGNGFFRGSSILITGTAGTGKSTFAAHFAKAACERGEKAIIFAFEESPQQILRNMTSVGLELKPHLDSGTLRIISSRPTTMGLEAHLATMHREVEIFKPSILICDPITNLISAGNVGQVKSMLTRLIDYLKNNEITAMFTNLTFQGIEEETAIGISSLMDAWILLSDQDAGPGNRRRVIKLLKARGMAHSTKPQEFTLNESGVHIFDEDGELLAKVRTLKTPGKRKNGRR